MPEDLAAAQRRTLGVLSGAQVLGGVGVSAHVTVGGLIAAGVAGTESVAGLTTTATTLGAALAALPLAGLTSDRGRRRGLAAGLLVGSVGALVVLAGARQASLPVILIGALLIGSATASGLQARYGATDLARPGQAARALSIVVWASTVGAVLGPNLADTGARTGRALGLPDLAGTYVVAAATFLGAALVVWFGLRPDPLVLARAVASAARAARPPRLRERTRVAWVTVRERRPARLGLAGVAAGHATMVGVMVMTPVHMAHAGVSLPLVGLVISLHVLGMFALSPLVGWATDRYGRHRVLVVGALALLTAAGIAGSASPDHSATMAAGLFLLGVGWSCTLVAGSTLLSESVPLEHRQEVQGLSDLAMNLCGAAAGAAAGMVVAVLSYGWLALGAAAMVLPLAVIAWSGRHDAPGPA